jgi:hypothetical protein
MNRSLLIFSILLILLGIGLGEFLIALFGFFLLFPALLSSPRPRPQGAPTGSGQQAPEPIRESAPVVEPAPVMETIPERAPVWGTVSTPVAPRTVAPTSMPPLPPSQPSFSAPLFPTSMFPSASQQMPTAQALKETKSEAPESRDEVLELGALLALVKLVFG